MKSVKFEYRISTVFTILLFITCTASAFYNPHIGRFLSRDPIEERGGKNQYGFVKNRPAGHWDYLGTYDPAATWCPFCKPVSVSVTYSPVQPPKIGLYDDSGISIRLGNDMTITWTVRGDPKKCTYSQNESGILVVNPLSRQPQKSIDPFFNHPDLKGEGIDFSYGLHSATYEDRMGVDFKFPDDVGEWNYAISMTINFWAHGSDGSVVYGTTVTFFDAGDIGWHPD